MCVLLNQPASDRYRWSHCTHPLAYSAQQHCSQAELSSRTRICRRTAYHAPENFNIFQLTSPILTRKGKFYLCYHFSIIVVSQGSTQFFIIHGRLIFPNTPELSYYFRINEFEFSFSSNPLNDISVLFLCQELKQKLPKLNLAIVPCVWNYIIRACNKIKLLNAHLI